MAEVTEPHSSSAIPQHTPGPWRAVDLRHQKGGQIRILSDAPGEYRIIANVLAAGARPAEDADLIVAAPKLLEALVSAVEHVEANGCSCRFCLQRLTYWREVIAEAKGQPS